MFVALARPSAAGLQRWLAREQTEPARTGA